MADETTPGSPEEQPGEPERPEWLPEKFKGPEDLAKSYSELESRLREAGEERSALESQLEDLYGRVQTMEQGAQRAAYDPSTDPTLLAYERAMEEGDYKAALAITAGLMQTVAQQNAPAQEAAKQGPQDYDAWAYIAEQTAVQQIGPDEWAAYKERVAAEAENENFDGLSAAQAGAKLTRIYKMVKAEDVLNNQGSVAEQQAEAERQAKIAAQTMTGASGRPPEPTKDEAHVSRILAAANEGSYDALLRGGE